VSDTLWADLQRAEATLDSEALVEAELRYADANESGLPPAPEHDEGECTVCDARREALRRIDASD
jgi:hypothetical protein